MAGCAQLAMSGPFRPKRDPTWPPVTVRGLLLERWAVAEPDRLPSPSGACRLAPSGQSLRPAHPSVTARGLA
jgi:hypothetical protein